MELSLKLKFFLPPSSIPLDILNVLLVHEAITRNKLQCSPNGDDFYIKSSVEKIMFSMRQAYVSIATSRRDTKYSENINKY